MARTGGISLGQIPIVDAPHSHAAAAKAVFVMDVPTYHKVLVVTDAAINIAPTLDDKVDICQNAIDVARALGVERPKVAILAAVETISAPDAARVGPPRADEGRWNHRVRTVGTRIPLTCARWSGHLEGRRIE